MKKVVLHHIASDYGKNYSIGFRSQKIFEYSKGICQITVICRSKKKTIINQNKIWTIDVSYLLSRIFSFIRIYLIPNFPSRKYELFIFNFLSLPYIIFHYLSNINNKKYFHSWDSSFWILFLIRKLNYFIIKDCAMTPSKSSIIQSQKNPKFYVDKTTSLEDINLEKKIFEISNLIISPSNYTTNFIQKEYLINSSKLRTVPFGAYLKEKDYKITLKKEKLKTIRFGFVGLVNMRKGIRWLINDLNELYKEDNLNFELHIFGRIFKEEINILSKAKFKIKKYGFVDTSKKNIYELFDILIHPSFIEGSAKCIYEAMASGLPIICSEQSGSLVQNKKNGFIIDAGDSYNFKKSIKYFYKNKKALIDMGEYSREIIKNYTWEKYAKQIILYY